MRQLKLPMSWVILFLGLSGVVGCSQQTQFSLSTPVVSTASISNNTLNLTGTNLLDLSQITIQPQGGGTATTFNVTSATSSLLKATPSTPLFLLAGTAYNMIVSSAAASTTIPFALGLSYGNSLTMTGTSGSATATPTYPGIFYVGTDPNTGGTDDTLIIQAPGSDATASHISFLTRGALDPVTIPTGFAGNEVMRITSSGYVGIGTTNPTTLFQIGSGPSGKASIYTRDNPWGQLQIGTPDLNGPVSIGFISGVTANSGVPAFGDTPQSIGGDGSIWSIGTNISGVGGNKFAFMNKALTGPAMFLQGDGKVGIVTDPSVALGAQLDVAGAAPAAGWINNHSLMGGGGLGLSGSAYIGTGLSIGTSTAAPSGGLVTTGSVGIGTASPTSGYTLEVEGNTWINGGLRVAGVLPSNIGPSAGAYYVNSGATTFASTSASTINWAIIATDGSGKIGASELWITSDKRIKTNIQDIDANGSLDLLRQIRPKKYQYIDSVTHGTNPRYGVIAQELEKILPSAVNTDKSGEFVPNIFEVAQVTHEGAQGTLITLHSKKIPFSMPSKGEKLKVRVIKRNNEKIELTVKSIESDKSFRVEEKLEGDTLFIYGSEIHDFKTVEYNDLLMVAVSALQQVDAEMQSTKKELEVAKKELGVAQEAVSKLQTLVQDILGRLSTLESAKH